ncbi:unnamed protein product [Acanthosepion pharaonis]|uniref:Uncharacterized protein n=1 Tax=Acanthosepion pharaonis TaxID=158019 RepID=A0A812CY25_ACAPH|nr:unnamed protein product [Sepia pharaonis]
MKRRVRVLPPGYLVGTKGHSVLKKKTYVRKPLIEVEEFSSQKMPTSRRHEFDSGYHMGSFHDAKAFSNAVMDDSYDLQAQSRGRDHRLLNQMNNALHTDSPLTSPLLSSRSSKPRSITQLQHKTRRSTRLDTSGTDPLKTSKLSDSLKTSRMSDSFKTSRPLSSPKLSKLSDSLKISKTSDSFKTSKLPASPKLSKLSSSEKMPKPLASLKLSKLSDSLKTSKPSDSLKLSKPSGSLQLSKLSDDSLQLPKPAEYQKKNRPKPAESLQLVKVPDSSETSKLLGIDRVSPVVEQARSLVNRHRTFGIGSDLDTIATSAITSPRDLKSDFFSVSPLTNYIKSRWPEKEYENQFDLTSPLTVDVLHTPLPKPVPTPIPTPIPIPKKSIYKNPYLEYDDLSADEDYETSVVARPKKTGKPGQLLKALRKKRSPDYISDESTDDEDYTKGACALTKYRGSDYDEEESEYLEKPRRSKKYELEESPNEIALSHLVSAAALRARAVLENLTGLLGKGGLVNVEGDIKPYGGPLTTFRLHTPFHFQGPLMIGEKPALSVGDNSFERYIFELQEKRKQERENVEKDARRITKLTRSLSNEPPKQYSLKPVGYISDSNYESFSKSLVPYTNKFDKTIVSPSSKKVHFDEADEPKKPTLGLPRELVPFMSKGMEDGEMAVVPKRKRYPVYEYTEDIPLKLSIEFPRFDDDTPDDTERLSVLEKIRIKFFTPSSSQVSTDFRRPPKAAVAALRASRTPVLASKPISLRATHRPKSKEVPATGPYYLSSFAGYIPGRTKRILALSSNYRPNVVFLDSDEYAALYPRSTKFRRSDPLYIGRRATARTFYQHRYYLPWYAGWRAVARGRYLRSVPRIYYGRAYQLPELTFKALLVGDDKLDVLDRPRSRKPRTRYYADKLQKMEDKEQLSSIMAEPPTSKLRASKPPKPIPTYTWRAIRDVDGYTKPANVMSWQYRLESRVDPDDLIHKPSTYGKMRDQVRGVQDKLGRHRQLLDRHADRVVADTGYGDSYAAGGHFSAGRTTEEGGADGTGKVSPLRKKLRKVICKFTTANHMTIWEGQIQKEGCLLYHSHPPARLSSKYVTSAVTKCLSVLCATLLPQIWNF